MVYQIFGVGVRGQIALVRHTNLAGLRLSISGHLVIQISRVRENRIRASGKPVLARQGTRSSGTLASGSRPQAEEA